MIVPFGICLTISKMLANIICSEQTKKRMKFKMILWGGEKKLRFESLMCKSCLCYLNSMNIVNDSSSWICTFEGSVINKWLVGAIVNATNESDTLQELWPVEKKISNFLRVTFVHSIITLSLKIIIIQHSCKHQAEEYCKQFVLMNMKKIDDSWWVVCKKKVKTSYLL